MGVQGLWSLLDPVGKPVTLESLQGKVIAVDISMWLHQAMKGMRDSQGNAVHNAHLHVLFNRVCKLLFYKIKPVFVFDGGVPVLKRQTLAARRSKREEAIVNKEKTAKKLLSNVLKHHAFNTVLGKNLSSGDISMPPVQRERDLFELNPLPENDRPFDSYMEDSWEERIASRQELHDYFQDLDDIDIESDDFKTLPPEVQHEILSEIKETRKYSSLAKIDDFPETFDDFSNYQVSKLLKQSNLSQKIDNVRKEMNSAETSELAAGFTEDRYSSEIISRKLASDDSTHIVLIKGLSRIPKELDESTDVNYEKEVNTIFQQKSKQLDSKVKDSLFIEPEGDDKYKGDGCFIPKKSSSGINNDDSKANDSLLIEPEDDNKYKGEVGFFTEENTSGTKNELFESCSSEILEIKPNQSVFISQSSNITDSEEIFVAKTGMDNDLITCELPLQTEQSFESTENTISSIQNINQSVRKSHEESLMTKSKDGLYTSDDGETYLVEDSLTESLNPLDNKSSDKQSSDSDSDFVEVSEEPEHFVENHIFPLNLFETNESKSELQEKEGTNLSVNSNKGPENESEHGDKPTDFNKIVNQYKGLDRSEIENMQLNVELESANLIKQRGKDERLATSITDQIQKEAQDLLILFGIPFVISPMEAEAQCAFLDLTNQTMGTITDDSDIWLFGGKRVYRNFFNQNKHLELFEYKDIENRLLLNRNKLINLAYLCGCDYTDGIQGIGPVTGLEILLEFPGQGISGLKQMKNWWESMQSQPLNMNETKLKSKLRQMDIGKGFPNSAVYEAFMNPEIDESEDKFTWSNPDLDLLRDFAIDKLGWNKSKADEVLLPVFKKIHENDTQTTLTQFFTKEFQKSKSPAKSKRVKRILDRMKTKSDCSSQLGEPKAKRKLPAKKVNKSKNKTGAGWVKPKAAATNVQLSENSSDED